MNGITLFNKEISMTSREISDLVDSRHDSVKRTIETLVKRGVIASPQTVEKPTAGRTAIEYLFTGEQGKRDSIVVVAQLSPEFTARLVDRWQELEAGLNTLPQNLPDALRLAADLAEQKAIAESERDEAIRTKALIGDKRQATAMAKASVLSRKLKKAEEMLGESANWKTTKAIDWLLEKFEKTKPMYQQVGKHLTRLSAAMGREVKKVESTDYGTVKSYHIDVINAFLLQLSSDPELLAKYRKA